jgi:hypothetical protein
MTIHSAVDYKCINCGDAFIPIPESFNCPKCGQKSETIFSEFIDQALGSALYNIERYGSVISHAWLTLNTGDTYYRLAFDFISSISKRQRKKEIIILSSKFNEHDAQSLASEFLSKINLGDNSYMQDYLKVYLTQLLLNCPLKTIPDKIS